MKKGNRKEGMKKENSNGCHGIEKNIKSSGIRRKGNKKKRRRHKCETGT